MPEAVIEAKQVTYLPPDSTTITHVILDSIDLTVNSGETVGIIGPSGCGKTTFMNIVGGLEKPSSGSIKVLGNEPSDVKERISYAFARDALMPWRTALDNVRLPLELRKIPVKFQKEEAYSALERVGLGTSAMKHPAELSQGMRQRVAFARALVTNPDILLLDEPFAALDAQLKVRMEEWLLRMLSNTQMTVLFVSHDISEAITLASRIIVFSQQPAKVLKMVSVEVDKTLSVGQMRSSVEFETLYGELWKSIELANELNVTTRKMK